MTLIFFSIGVASSVASRGILSAQIGGRINYSIGEQAMKSLLRSRFSYLETRSAGDIVNRISSIQVIQILVSDVLLNAIFDLIATLFYGVILLRVSILIGIIVLGTVLLYVITLLISGSKMYQLAMGSAQMASITQSKTVQIASAMEIIKVSQAEEKVLNQWRNNFLDEINYDIRYSSFQSLIAAIGSLIQYFLPLSVTVYGLYLVSINVQSIGTVAAINTLLGSLLGSTLSISYVVQHFLSSRSALDRVRDIVSAPCEDDEVENLSKKEATFYKELTVSSIGKTFTGSNCPVFKDVSFSLHPGEFVGLVGKTGAGKTTLLRILISLEKATEGEIKFDGCNLIDLNLRSIRSLFGVVAQENAFIPGTIRDNLEISVPGEICGENIMKALRVAALDKEIERMPMGLNTYLGEGGGGISGGQRQRLSIARAVLRSPSVLVLDEATNALDTKTELEIFKNLKNLGVTIICATHRESTLKNADFVMELSDGKLFIKTQ